MSMNDELLRLIDQRIASAVSQPTRMGTVSDRQQNNRAMVVLDGSSQAVPVKVFANAHVLEGDRVGLVKFGSEWVVIGGFTPRQFGGIKQFQNTAPSGSTTSTVHTPMNQGSVTFRKLYSSTRIWVSADISAYTNGATHVYLSLGLNLIAPSYNVIWPFIHRDLVNALEHDTFSVAKPIPGTESVPPGEYTAQPVWRVASGGGGSVNVDAGDEVNFAVMEVGY